jgi:phosphoglycerate kinase
MEIKSLLHSNLKNKQIVLRVDYNVPLKNGKITDDTRIRESLPTIKYLLKQNCSIVIISHLGRPEGKPNPEFSLGPIAKRLKKLLGKKVLFLKDEIDQELVKKCQTLKPKQIVMLENIRFYPGEEKNDIKLAELLSKFGEAYVNDAFGCAHRAHASIHAITQFLPSCAGFLLEKEVEKLSLLLGDLPQPVSFIIGGAKIDTKIELIKSFAGKVDYFIFGGGIANTFLAGKGYQLANSLVQKNMLETAKEIETAIRRKNKNINLPKDFIIAPKIGNYVWTKNFSGKQIPKGYSILDIGKNSTNQFATLIKKSGTVIWNGPMGVSEYKPFRQGTKKIAQAIVQASRNGATTIIGGGDTIEALKTLKISPKNFTHVSTGGGAMLEFLEKGTLPGIEVLKN